MIAVLLQILKIIGIVILVLLGLLLLVLILILFGAIRLRVEAEHIEDVRLAAQVSWIGLLKAGYSFEAGEQSYFISAFGIRVYPRKKKTSSKASVKEEMIQEPLLSEEAADVPEEIPKRESGSAAASAGVSEPSVSVNPEKKRKFKRNGKTKKEKSDEPGILQKGIRMIKKVHRIWSSEAFQYVYDKAKETLSYILRHINWKQASGDAAFSMGSPDYTGYVTGILAMFPFAYGKKLTITPDFASEEIYAKGKIKIQCSMRLIFVLIAMLRFIVDRKVRKGIARTRKLMEEQDYG